MTIRAPMIIAAIACLSGALMAADQAEAQSYASERHDFRLVTLARGLENPWALAFLPNGDMLVTERPGRLRIVRGGELLPTPVPGVPEAAHGGQGGLLDVVLHPRFEETRWIYLSYAGAGEGGAGTEVARARLVEDRLVDLETIARVEPKSRGGRHFGSRLVFGPDGSLYVTSGERGDADRAQDLGDPAGAVLRILEDGGMPPDNPFIGRPGARADIFTWGHRNPQGLALQPETGRLWAVEHGPKGGDELNLLAAGVNYGWPTITHGRSYAGFKIGEGSAKEGMAQPVRYWVPSISPSGLAFYRGTEFPSWRGNLFLGALSGRALLRLELDGETVVHEERLLEDLGARIRDVRQGPDGRLYLLTDAADGALLRLEPSP
jgi:glucose/arabinose dehydrogenase